MGGRANIPAGTLLGGKIRLIQRIGRGGMGEVWVARNEATQAELAVKTLARSERTPVHDERFRREARLSATISHRHVVRVFDLIDEEDGTLGLVMELLRGGTLGELLKERGTLTSLQTIAVAVPILSAMHHVHQKGIIHRDVTPANVFFAVEPDGHVIPKILDFGIAKLPAAGSALTMDGSVLGTPHYMSPEQIRGNEDIDGRSDMFSFAVVIYEMLTGNRVFHREAASASLAAVLEHEVDPDPRIEPRLWIAISRALAKRPYERYANCAEFAEALRAAVPHTEDDLANTLQEMRPRETVPNAESTTGASSVVISGVNEPAARVSQRRSTFGVIAIAIGAATFAVGLTLTLTRSSEPTPPAARSSTPPTMPVEVTSAAPTTAASFRSSPPSLSSAADRAAMDDLDSPPITAPAPSPKKPASRPVSSPPPKPPKPKGGVATTPGF